MSTETYNQERLLAMIESVKAREIQALADKIKTDFLNDLESGTFMCITKKLLFWKNEYTSHVSDIDALYAQLRVYFPDIYMNIVMYFGGERKLVVSIDPRRRKEAGEL